jgi:hypothetical protein
MMKPIRFSGHAQQQMIRRGVSEEEVVTVIQLAKWESATGDRLECRHDFPFAHDWNGKLYQTKQVRPIFVDEAEEIVVITVYSYYF